MWCDSLILLVFVEPSSLLTVSPRHGNSQFQPVWLTQVANTLHYIVLVMNCPILVDGTIKTFLPHGNSLLPPFAQLHPYSRCLWSSHGAHVYHGQRVKRARTSGCFSGHCFRAAAVSSVWVQADDGHQCQHGSHDRQSTVISGGHLQIRQSSGITEEGQTQQEWQIGQEWRWAKTENTQACLERGGLLWFTLQYTQRKVVKKKTGFKVGNGVQKRFQRPRKFRLRHPLCFLFPL